MPTSDHSGYLHCSRTTSLTSRTAVYGPVRTVVWQGLAGDRRPYADQTGLSEIDFEHPFVSDGKSIFRESVPHTSSNKGPICSFRDAVDDAGRVGCAISAGSTGGKWA